MRYIVATVALTALLASGVARAQTALDHDVQRSWDDVFHPDKPGDPRTNWERQRDADIARGRRTQAERAAYERRRHEEHVEWCHNHPGDEGCGRY